MLGETSSSWRTERREAARVHILSTASSLAREHGLTGWTLRDLARRLGMAAPSLYSYFDSKDALYDAMFAEGNRAAAAIPIEEAGSLRDQLATNARTFLAFCVEDPVRYQLLYQRTIPGFTPSEESWQLAREAYARMMAPLARFGITEQADLDLITGCISGLASQQLSNEPEGTRWVKQLDVVVDLLAGHFAKRTRTSRRKPSAAATT